MIFETSVPGSRSFPRVVALLAVACVHACGTPSVSRQSHALEELDPSVCTPSAVGGSPLDYDLVYVRHPRRGDSESVRLPDGERPYTIEAGADLVLLHPNCTQEILVECHGDGTGENNPAAPSCSVQDPVISYDGRWVYYVKYIDLTDDRHTRQPAHAFLFKMRLDVPESERVEIQLTDVGDGYQHDKLAGNGDTPPPIMGLRDLAPALLPDGRIVFTSNREALVAPHETNHGQVTALAGATVSTLYVMDDHDGSEPNRNMKLLGYGNLHAVQHPIVLRDGRLLFTNWDDAGIRDNYGSTTLYISRQDGTHLEQFLEPHNDHKRVDHFAAELPSGHVVVPHYYPFMRTWGFGPLHRYPVSHEGQSFSRMSAPQEDDYRLFSRLGLQNMTPHTNGADYDAPDDSGRYGTPFAGPDDVLWVAYSDGPVASDPLAGSDGLPKMDSGLCWIEDASTVVISDPEGADGLPVGVRCYLNHPDYNEIWPRPVVPYARTFGTDKPADTPPESPYGPTRSFDSLLVPGAPVGISGSSSVLNRESEPDRDRFNGPHGKLNDPAWIIQGADSGQVADEDVWGVRVLAVTPSRYHPGNRVTDLQDTYQLVDDDRRTRTARGYYSHTEESWKILGEFPVRNEDGTPDPSGAIDTSFLTLLPANTPFLFQIIDERGMTLTSEQTWRHVGPGDVFAHCGGCHAHSEETSPIAFEGKWANSHDYEPWDLVRQTPMARYDGPGAETRLDMVPGGMAAIEYTRDIYPLLDANCAGCHTADGDNAPPNGAKLQLFDGTISDVRERQLFAYAALARDRYAERAHDTVIPAEQSRYHAPNASRYIRMLQARASLLTWKVYGERLDGRTNDTFGSGRYEDIDFTCPPDQEGCCQASVELDYDDKGLISRWIDLGAPIDRQFTRDDEPVRMHYTSDSLVPVVTAELVDAGEALLLRVGLLDMESGIDTGSLAIEVEHDGASQAYGYADLDFDEDAFVGVLTLPVGVDAVDRERPLSLAIEVRDVVGNAERLNRVFDRVGGAVEPQSDAGVGDGGARMSADGGTSPGTSDAAGCACRAGRGGSRGPLVGLVALFGLVTLRQRRRRSRRE